MNVSGGLRETLATKAAGFSDLMGTAEAVPPSKLLLKPFLGDRRPWRHSVFILRNRILQASLLAAAILWLTGCPPRASIAEINRDRGRYLGKELTIAGRVSDSFGALSTGVFQVDDGTGTMWVYSQNYGVPSNGAKVSVTGKLEQGFNFGGRTFAAILRETQARH